MIQMKIGFRVIVSFLFAFQFSLVHAQCDDCDTCIVFNEFSTDPYEGLNGTPDDTGEFIELFNKCDVAVEIGCFVICFTDVSGGARRGDCFTIPAGTVLGPGDTYVMGGYGTNCTGGTVDCDFPGLVLDFNWHADANTVWDVVNNTFYINNIGNYIGVLRDAGEDITMFSACGVLLEAVHFNGGPGFGANNTENIGAIAGCPANSVTIPPSADHLDVGNTPGGQGADEGWKLDCDGNWSFAQANPGTSYELQNPGVSEGCALVSCGTCIAEITGDTTVCVDGTNQLAGSGTPNATDPWTSNDPLIASVDNNGLVTGVSEGVVEITYTDDTNCSIIQLLTVLPSYNETDAATICDGDNYTFGTQTLTTSGVYSETFTSVHGCDSIVELTLTVNPTYNETDAATICDGDSYIFGTQTLTTVGVYTETFTSVLGCDSIVELTLTVNPTYNETDAATICDGDSYIFGTQTLTTVGVYTETFTSVLGCDSIVELTLTVNPTYNETDAATICDGDSYTFGTQTLTIAGIYTETFTSVSGCDSIIELTLTVNPTYNETDAASICDGDSYTFGTQTLTTAGVYTEPFSSITGCDSIVELTLSVVTSFSETDVAEICDGDSYIFGTQTLTTAGVYTETFISLSGCDSLVELTLTVNPIYNETDAATICDGDSYIFGTQTLTTVGVYTETFTSVSGCDSIVELTLTVNPTYNETDAATICVGDSYTFGTQTLTTSGVYTETFTLVQGCDSIVELTLTVNPTYNETDAATICDGDSYTFGTQTLTTSGVYSETFTSVQGCDSLVELTLNVVTSFNETTTATICDGDSYTFGTQTLTTAGVYSETFISVTGCDSLVELTLSVVTSFNETDVATICDGDSYTFGTQTLTTTGVYTETFISVTGCDSLVELTLTVNPIYNETAAATICNGASYIFGTQTLTTSGVYSETFTSVSGCDSIVELTLTVNASYNETETAAICEGDSYTFGTQSLTASGVYSETFMALSGCDSIVELTLTVNPLPSIDAGTDLTICSGGSATLQVTGGADYLWDNGLGAGDSHLVSPGSTTLYTVNGVDVNGCENSDQVTVFVESPPTIDAILTDVSCFGFTDGNINLTPNGNGPFVFTWTPNVSTTNNATNLNAGTYTVEVEDGNGCVSNASFTLVEPDEITYTVSSVDSDCSVDNGSATINVSGGSGSYTYTWSPAAGNTATLSNIGAGDYEVTISVNW
jgi:uncharacterized protein YceK